MPVNKYVIDQNEDDGYVMKITVKNVIKYLKSSRKVITIYALVGALVGTIYVFNKPDIFTVDITVMPEMQTKGSGGLSGLGSLAGLAGVNIDNINGQDAIKPDLYPTILKSVPFSIDLLKQEVYSRKFNSRTTFQRFLERMNKDGLVNQILNLFDNKEAKKNSEIQLNIQEFSKVLQVSKEQENLIKQVQSGVTANYEKKTGLITITAIQSDPIVAATISRLTLDYLTNYITIYRTEKARNQVTFLIQQVKEAQDRYKSTEYNLSSYRDRNRSLYLNTAKISEQSLQADYLLAQTVYNDLSKQLEQAKIKVQEETPVFKILDPPQIPLRKSGPKRAITIILFTMLGTIAGATYKGVKAFWKLVEKQA